MTSHGFLFRANTTTCGSSVDESSNVPTLIVTYPSIPLLRPKIRLPQVGQKTFVT